MSDTPHITVPDIIRNISPVTEQFGPLSYDASQMQIPKNARDISRSVYQLLTKAEQTICDQATD